jgi:hypothetical protein
MMLPFILHHANRCTKHPAFYAIKDQILARHGVVVGHDIQHIEGKRCFSCSGTGVHHKYDRHGFVYDSDSCWHCVGGWYKRPMWIMLERRMFGKYIFHKPIRREYTKNNPFEGNYNVVEGYISHYPRRYSYLALWLLYLVYNRKMLLQEVRQSWTEYGRGWRLSWWLPSNYFRNMVHIIKRGRRSYPLTELRDWWKKRSPVPDNQLNIFKQHFTDNDHPF